MEQAFIPLFNVEPALDAPLAAWLVHAPNSYAAHLAMALHTERQIEWLHEYDERNSPSFNRDERTRFAMEHVQASLARSRRPALSLMSQYRLTPQRRKQFPGWVDRMVAIDPDDVLMRREYLIQHPVCPCRGLAPDDPAMRDLLGASPSPRVRDTLAAYRLFERGTDAGNTQQALGLFTQGLALDPVPQDAYTMRINTAVALIEWHRLDEAATQLQAAIAMLPGNRHAHEELGDVYELQKRMPAALAQFLVDAERGQSWAQMRVGSFMLTPEAGVPLDRRTGAYWMRRAANNGEERARDILRRHPDLMRQYPPTSDESRGTCAGRVAIAMGAWRLPAAPRTHAQFVQRLCGRIDHASRPVAARQSSVVPKLLEGPPRTPVAGVPTPVAGSFNPRRRTGVFALPQVAKRRHHPAASKSPGFPVPFAPDKHQETPHARSARTPEGTELGSPARHRPRR